jgi:hypothetical protein
MEPCIANEKPECARHKRYIEEKVAGELKGNHLKNCALNRKGKSKDHINEHPTVWPSNRLHIPFFGHSHFLSSFAFFSATIGARTASNGDLIGPICSTANNRRLVLPSIGDDHA